MKKILLLIVSGLLIACMAGSAMAASASILDENGDPVTGSTLSLAPGQQLNLTFEVLYDGQESYDGELTKIDKRLDVLGLEGKAVAFIIQVAAGDSTDGDRIFWLAPRLEP